ncbi:MAG TPA: CDP-alcohol phosphatidyltransferase family protein [Bryobacteraceae bacterium]|nr:CDP-alcohol phosphatidyltransferase family protein [Bryobacteraceae bacterium]
MNATNFANPVRVHKALTAAIEKRALVWMALRTPQCITPDHLTSLALCSQILAGVAYAFAHQNPAALWLVNLFLVLNWLGDSLDGTLARVRNRQRPCYGFYVDHVADALGALALMAGLGCSRYLHWQIAVGLLVCFYLLSIESYLATVALGDFHVSHGLFGPTEIRLLLMVGNFVVMAHPIARIGNYSLLVFDLGGGIAILAMVMMALRVISRHVTILYREEASR